MVLLLKSFLAFLLFPLSFLLAQEPNSCPKDFQCPNLGNLSFPFTNISKPDCGICSVDCNSQTFSRLYFRSSDQIFYAVRSFKNNSIKLIDTQLQSLLNNRSCNTFYHEINLPDSSSVSFRISSNTTTIFRCWNPSYLNQQAVDDFRHYGYKRDASCDGFQILYRNPESYPSPIEYLTPGCSAIQLPLRSWDLITNASEVFDLLSFEFDLQWDLHRKKNSGNSSRLKAIIIAISAIAGDSILNVLAIFLICRCKKRIQETDSLKLATEDQDLEIFLKNHGSLTPKRYSYTEVNKMTNSFDTKLGQGGYGSVYKGKLQDGTVVAVVLKESKGKGEEFINEVASISRTSHVNIVSLLGFCVQGLKKALIYEFMPNGSLEKFIYEEKASMNRRLEWQTLYNISVGIARGLEYLHRGCNTRILHFDIKPHNILLDENFCPKISDFGLAKLCTRKESIISTIAARGTIGYITPEIVCKNIGGVSHKSDVYSYGIMVLEMVGGRKNVNVRADRTSEIYFPHWIYPRLCQGEELGLSGIKDEEENKQSRKMLIASLWCIQTNPFSRPTISEVLEMLEGPVEAMQMPPKPFLYDSPSRPASLEGFTNYSDSVVMFAS